MVKKRCRDSTQTGMGDRGNAESSLKKEQRHPGLFKDNCIFVGGKVKAENLVLMEHGRRSSRIFYLDRLNRDPVEWGIFPRVKVWDMKQIRIAAKEDRISCSGDYGKLGMLDVAYSEQHPLAARDTNGPTHTTEVGMTYENPRERKLKKKRRGATSNKNPHERKAEKALISLPVSPNHASSNCPLPVMRNCYGSFFLV